MPAALAENSQVICEVWANNLEEEMRKIREIVLSYSYIAMVNVLYVICLSQGRGFGWGRGFSWFLGKKRFPLFLTKLS